MMIFASPFGVIPIPFHVSDVASAVMRFPRLLLIMNRIRLAKFTSSVARATTRLIRPLARSIERSSWSHSNWWLSGQMQDVSFVGASYSIHVRAQDLRSLHVLVEVLDFLWCRAACLTVTHERSLPHLAGHTVEYHCTLGDFACVDLL